MKVIKSKKKTTTCISLKHEVYCNRCVCNTVIIFNYNGIPLEMFLLSINSFAPKVGQAYFSHCT